MPFYVSCVLTGVDESGQGAVYAYDSVGSFERVRVACVGSAQPIILPILDQLIDASSDEYQESEQEFFQRWPTPERPQRHIKTNITCLQALEYVKSAAAAADERDIRFGDWLDIVSIATAERHERISQRLHEH